MTALYASPSCASDHSTEAGYEKYLWCRLLCDFHTWTCGEMSSIIREATLALSLDHSRSNVQTNHAPPILCEDEWSPLQEVIVGRAEHSYFPSEPRDHMEAIMPTEHLDQFRPGIRSPHRLSRKPIKSSTISPPFSKAAASKSIVPASSTGARWVATRARCRATPCS